MRTAASHPKRRFLIGSLMLACTTLDLEFSLLDLCLISCELGAAAEGRGERHLSTTDCLVVGDATLLLE